MFDYINNTVLGYAIALHVGSAIMASAMFLLARYWLKNQPSFRAVVAGNTFVISGGILVSGTWIYLLFQDWATVLTVDVTVLAVWMVAVGAHKLFSKKSFYQLGAEAIGL